MIEIPETDIVEFCGVLQTGLLSASNDQLRPNHIIGIEILKPPSPTPTTESAVLSLFQNSDPSLLT